MPRLETDPKYSNKGITRDSLTSGNGKPISYITFWYIYPLYWLCIFFYNISLAWHFRSCWVHLKACKAAMSIKWIKITLPLALRDEFGIWMESRYGNGGIQEKWELLRKKIVKKKASFEQLDLWFCYKNFYWKIWTAIKKHI